MSIREARQRVWGTVLLGVALACAPLASSLPAAPLTADANTVALFRFDEKTGAQARDASGRNHHATLQKPPNDPQWHAKGRYGGCLAFDGLNPDANKDKTGDADGLFLPQGGAPDPTAPGITVELWVRHRHLAGPQFYLARSGRAGRYVFGSQSGSLFVHYYLGKGWTRAQVRRCLKAGVWHHVAFTHDRHALRLYLDGKERAKVKAEGPLAAGSKWTLIGRDTDRRPIQIRGLCGLMDELRISNIARTQFPKGPVPSRDPFPDSLLSPRQAAMTAGPKGLDLATVPLDRGGAKEDGRVVTVSGVVFLDADADGRRDPGERPLAGVPVSNDEDIVRTDAEGRYRFRFKIEDGRFVFVVTPTGYRPSRTFYRRIALTKATDYAYDLGLVEDPASLKKDFTFVAGGDVQYQLFSNAGYRQLVDDFTEMAALARDANFAIFPGDLTPHGKIENLMTLKRVVLDRWRKTFHAGFGAHDVLNPTKFGNFMDVFGPYYYSWDFGGNHFIFLVSELGHMSKLARERQFRWLKRDLAMQPKTKPIYVTCHTPEGLESQLAAMAKTHDVRAVMRAHFHIHNTYAAPNGAPVLCAAPYRSHDWGVFTRKCRVVTVKDGKLTSRMRVLGQVKRLIVTSPPPDGSAARGTVRVQANAYDTTLPVVAAEYEITGPNGKTTRGRLAPHSDWSWWADWDASAAPEGAYRLRVRVRADGASWRTESRFRLAAKAATPQPAEDWPSEFGAPGRLRATDRDLAPPLRLAWIGHTDALIYYFSSPIVAEGKVLVGVTDGEIGWPRAGVACFDARTGRRLWKTRTDADVHSSVAADGGQVYALSTNGLVHKMDLATGRQGWTRRASRPRFGWTMSLAALSVSAGRVLVAPDGSGIRCLDARTGKPLWQAPKTHGYYNTGSIFPASRVGYAAGHRWYAAVDLASGKEIWRKAIPRCRGVRTPILYGKRLYVTHRGYLRAVRPETGDEVWQARLGGPMTQSPGMPVEREGRVFISHGDAVWCFDAATGKRLWVRRTNTPALFKKSKWQSMAESSSPLVAGRHVYAGSDNGTFYCLDAATGKVLWSYFVGAPIKSSPALSGNMVFISAFDGNVYAFVAEGGK